MTTTITGATGIDNIQAATGAVIATYTSVLTNTVVFSSANYADSGLSITLTPRSTSSKFIITLNSKTVLDNTAANAACAYAILRDSTIIQSAKWASYLNRSDYTSDAYPILNVTHVDNPSTISSITYKIQGRKQSGDASNSPWTLAEGNGGNHYASLVIQEIAG